MSLQTDILLAVNNDLIEGKKLTFRDVIYFCVFVPGRGFFSPLLSPLWTFPAEKPRREMSPLPPACGAGTDTHPPGDAGWMRDEGCGMRDAGCGIWDEGCGMPDGCRMRDVGWMWEEGCGMPDGCGMRDAGCGMRDEGCEIWGEGCGMWDEGCGMPDGYGMRGAGWLRDAGCGVRAGCGMRDAGCRMLEHPWDRGGRSPETRSGLLVGEESIFFIFNRHFKTPPGCRFINTCPITMLILFLTSPSPPTIPLLSQQTIIFYY